MRRGMEHPPTTIDEQLPRWRVTRTPILAIVTVTLIFAACSSSEDEAATSVSNDDPTASVDAYFEAYNAGNEDAVLALLTTDTTLTVSFGGRSPEDYKREEWELDLAVALAEGTLLASPLCAVTEDQPVEGTTVSCDYETLDAPTQAVDALPVPTTTRFAIAPTGISEMHTSYESQPGQPDFLHVGEPFQKWLAADHPEFTCLALSEANGSCDDSPTSDEAITEKGLMTVRYAQEWGAYLKANGCTYLEGC
jgi:hypothetical protein